MISIAFDKYTLPNGLQVVLHEDHSLPMAAVNIWYHVGSKDEDQGRTGFAHLFEHVMFEGSKNHNELFFQPADEGRRVGERLHVVGQDELLGERAVGLPGACPVAGVGPDGLPVGGSRPEEARPAA